MKYLQYTYGYHSFDLSNIVCQTDVFLNNYTINIQGCLKKNQLH